MSLPQAISQPKQKLFLTIQAGNDKGVSYEVVTQKISIGRDSENDIALNDPKASRKHAVVEQNAAGLFIKDLGSQNGILVNGQFLRQSPLQNNDRFVIGSTEFLVDLKVHEYMLSKAETKILSQDKLQTHRSQAQGNRVRFYSIVAIIGILCFAIVKANKNKKPTELEIRSDSTVQTEIEAIQKRKELLNRQKELSGENSSQFNEAQTSYLKGFRDYREGNYTRAIQSFTAALAIYPDHVLAKKYKPLAERRLDETVQYSMFQGRKYMEQGKYEMAKSAYKNIMILINDPSNKTYREAQERFNEINLLLRGKY